MDNLANEQLGEGRDGWRKHKSGYPMPFSN